MTLAPETFETLVSIVVATSAAAWFAVDAVRLRRALPYTKESHDRVFGSLIGLAIAIIGMAGVVKFYLG